MPLSEHEQRLLDQIERALYAEDPKFASTVRSTDLRTHMRRRFRRSLALFVVGFVMLLLGVISNLAVGIAGFVVMLSAMLLAVSSYKRMNGSAGTTTRPVARGSEGKKARTQSSPKDRLEERWKKRWEERGGPE